MKAQKLSKISPSHVNLQLRKPYPNNIATSLFVGLVSSASSFDQEGIAFPGKKDCCSYISDALPIMCCEMRLRFGTTQRVIWRNWSNIYSQRRTPLSFYSAKKAFTAASMLPNTKKKKVIVISGPTGAGKSRLALEIAKRLGGEIISADSVQVYRGLDIGSAKPSISEMNIVPHYLIDIFHASEDYSAGLFFNDARRAIKDVLDRGRVPIVAGGTGLYLRWYIYGKPSVPKPSVDIMSGVWSELVDLQKSGQWDKAVDLVVNAGDLKARDLPLNNWNRLKHSLEIIRSSRVPPSAFTIPYNVFCEQLETKPTVVSGNRTSEAKELDYDFIYIFLACPRVDLYRSIDLRCEEMLADTGRLLSEASWLLDIGLHPNMNPATRAIDYTQAMEYLLYCKQNGGMSSHKSS